MSIAAHVKVLFSVVVLFRINVNSVIVSLSLSLFSWQYDLSLPLPKMYDLVLDMRKKLGTLVTNVTGYGHLGDGENCTICHR